MAQEAKGYAMVADPPSMARAEREAALAWSAQMDKVAAAAEVRTGHLWEVFTNEFT
jgi:hypothetical protein